MAARQNQALHIAVILLVMVTVALSVTTFLSYKSATTEQKNAAAAKQQAEDQKRAFETEDFKNRLLEWMIGVRELDKPEVEQIYQRLAEDDKTKQQIEKIKTEFEQDMLLFQGSNTVLGTPEGWIGAQNWQSLADYLVQVIQKRNQEWNDEKSRADRIETEKVAQVNAHLAKADQASQGQQKAQADLLAANEQYNTDRGAFQVQERTLQETINKTAQAAKLEVDTKNKTITALNTELTKYKLLNTNLVSENSNLQRKDYDVPQGSIRWVNQNARNVYIDLGAADALKRQQTFSVYDRDETNHNKAEPKGSIEVTKIVESHLAEARILDDDLRNPILPGDFIYTPAWVPGRRLHFALAGWMDINEDDKSDRQLIKNLITLNGGIVDAEVDDQGEKTGQITVHTRYLLIGDQPTSTTDGRAIKAYTDITTEAEQLGIEVMPLDRFLGIMGYRGEVTTNPLGRHASETKFKPRRPPPSAYDD